MSWTCTIWGHPPTLNSLYQIGWRTDHRGRRYRGIVKSSEAQRYHDHAVLQIRAARPSGWQPAGQIRLRIKLYLAADIDADNTLKVLSDAIETAIGLNDRMFLPCIEAKTVGLPVREARVEVTFDEVSASP